MSLLSDSAPAPDNHLLAVIYKVPPRYAYAGEPCTIVEGSERGGGWDPVTVEVQLVDAKRNAANRLRVRTEDLFA